MATLYLSRLRANQSRKIWTFKEIAGRHTWSPEPRRVRYSAKD